MTETSDFSERAADLEKTLRNIISIGYRRSSPASRMVEMLNVAEGKIMEIEENRRTINRINALKEDPAPL